MAEPEPCADEWTVVQRDKGRKRGNRRQTTHRHSRGGKTAGVPAVQVDASALAESERHDWVRLLLRLSAILARTGNVDDMSLSLVICYHVVTMHLHLLRDRIMTGR